MKQYLIVDLCSDLKKLGNSNDIKELLIGQITQDMLNYYYEEDIVISNTKLLCSLASDIMSLKTMIQELEPFGYKVIDLLDLQRDLEDFKQYWGNKGNYKGNFDMILKTINEEVNKNV